MAIPTLDLSRLPPGQMTMPYLAGGAIEGGRSMAGIVNAVSAVGSGIVCCVYKQIVLGNVDPARMRYASQLAAILNGGVRSIIVPLLVDFIQPAKPAQFTQAQSMAGGVLFDTPAGDFPDTMEPAALNAGTVTLNVGSRTLTGGEWFGMVHPTKLNRAYQVTDIDSVTQSADGSRTFTVGIRPTIREAVPALIPVSFDRPSCLMRLAPGTTIQLDVQSFWWATPDISLIESFGTT